MYKIAVQLVLTSSGAGEEAGDDDDDTDGGGVTGSKMGVRSWRSCWVHRSWGCSGTLFGVGGLANDSSTKPDGDRERNELVNKTENDQ